MTKTKKIALLSMMLASAEAAFELADKFMDDAGPGDGDLAQAGYDAARAFLNVCRDNLATARRARGYQCPHTAALIAANID